MGAIEITDRIIYAHLFRPLAIFFGIVNELIDATAFMEISKKN